MQIETFLIDGKHHTAEECIKLFQKFQLGNREKKCLDYVDSANQDILDLGCLYGLFAKELKKIFPNKNIVAGDYCENNLKISKLINPDIRDIFKKMSAYSLSMDSSSVDCILFQEVIEHLEGAAQAVKEINRVLRKNGSLIISTPTPYYWKDMWQHFKYELLKKYIKKNLPLSDAIYFKEHEWNRHIYCWTPTTLLTLLKVNGFEYSGHTYCQEGNGFLERLFLKCFPFFSPTMIIKVKKIAEAPLRLV